MKVHLVISFLRFVARINQLVTFANHRRSQSLQERHIWCQVLYFAQWHDSILNVDTNNFELFIVRSDPYVRIDLVATNGEEVIDSVLTKTKKRVRI